MARTREGAQRGATRPPPRPAPDPRGRRRRASCATGSPRCRMAAIAQAAGRLLGPAALPLRHQGAALRRRARPTPTPSPAASTAQAMEHAGERAAPSGSRRCSTGACPATSGWPTTGCSGRSWPCCASATPSWPRSAPSSTTTSTPRCWHRPRGVRPGVFAPDRTRARMVAETAVALCDGLGARVLAPDPPSTLDDARRRSPRPSACSSATTARCPRRPTCCGSTHMSGLRRRSPRRAPADGRPGAAARLGVCPRLRLPAQRRARRGGTAAGVRQGRDRRRPRLLQLGRLPRPERDQGLPEGVRRQDHRVELRLDGGHVRQDQRRQPLRHRLPDRQVGAEAARRGQAARASTTTSSPTPTRSSTRAPTSTTPGTTPKSAASVPFTVYKTGIGWRTDKVDDDDRQLGGPLERRRPASRIFTLDDQDEALAMAALLPRATT